MRQHRVFQASAPFLLTLAACGGSATPASSSSDGTVAVAKSSLARDPAQGIPASSLAGAVTANNAFALDLYGRLSAASPTSNLFTSPISASLALSMTYAGAAGETATQMAAALHLGSGATTIFDGQNALTQALGARAAAALAGEGLPASGSDGMAPAPSTSDYQLQLVNSVWGEKTYTWASPFLDTLARSYGTGVYQEDFIGAPDVARQAIDTWVSDETAGKIADLLPAGSLDASTRMVLVNAVHLKLPWASPFEAQATASGTFTRSDGTTVSASFMKQTMMVARYVDDGAAQILELPLSGNDLVVDIALPHGDLAAYEAGLTASSAPIAGPTGNNTVQLSLPKVAFTSATFSLAAPLAAMGMTDAFNPSAADFSGLCANAADARTLYVGDVKQKAMIAMTETGVEAAAATAVGILSGAAPVSPAVMNVDKPFLLSIRDVPTGAVLFVGHIADPTDAGAQ